MSIKKFIVLFIVLLAMLPSYLLVKGIMTPQTPEQKLEKFLSLNKASPQVSEAYRFALENPQGVLSIVKCYCGCLTNGASHKNNLDCFFNEDESFDLMSLNCGLCVKTALLSKQMLSEGKTVDEIASFVDQRWGN